METLSLQPHHGRERRAPVYAHAPEAAWRRPERGVVEGRTGEEPERRGPSAPLRVTVTTTASDAHTWNLVYLQLLIEEMGHTVTNLGCCVPDELIVSHTLRTRPDLLVVSSVNGHGYQDGLRVVTLLRGVPELSALPVVIGGKLGTTGGLGHSMTRELIDAGFDAVFEENGTAVTALRSFVGALHSAGEHRP
ncbi:cobalamin B12-binding domain-containing protein [Streptosporangium algeriense]|uniref:Cobalamin B12-binding domain-containing protein n=1 Tax=Streptosporangium algeriense TaxID=1682748 RepID=A0ABW3DWZ4_9ACTN